MLRHPVLRQLHLVCAVLGFVATFWPLWSAREPGDAYETMSLWGTVAAGGGADPGVLGLVLVAAMVTACVCAATLRPGPGVPSSVVVLAVLGLVMLVAKPGAGSPAPDRGPGASTLFALCLVLLALGLLELGSFLAGGYRRDADPRRSVPS